MFVPRHPVIQNQFCQFNTTSGVNGAGAVLAYAGSVCYLDDTSTNTEATVKIYIADERIDPFGFLMQKVKSGYHSIHPPGFYMPGDLGSSDVIAQPSYNNVGVIAGTKAAPVGVAHLGIWDTIHYYDTAIINPGAKLLVRKNSMSELTDLGGSTYTQAVVVAVVVKGASAAQVAANVANTTLYPIRVKLLV